MGASTHRRKAVDAAARQATKHLQITLPKPKQPSPAPTSQSTNPFSYFDHIYLLNLDRETDRLQRASRRLQRLGIAFERISALLPQGDEPYDPTKPDLRPGHYAAARSHRRIIEQAMKAQHQRVLVLEDDVVFRDDVAQWMQRLIPQLESVPWDMFYFGLHLAEDGGPVTENLGKVLTGFHTHAYAVTAAAMPKLMATIEQSISQGFNYDCFEGQELFKVYAQPILAIQEPNRSEIMGRHTNRLGQYFPKFDAQEFMDHCEEARNWKRYLKKETAVGELLRKAKLLHQSGKPASAEPIYNRALAMEPENAEALHYLGLLKHQLGQGAAAVDLLYRAMALEPERAEFQCNLGIVLGKAGRTEEALEVLSRAIETRPDYAEAYENLGVVLDRLGRIEDSQLAWEKAIELRPQFAEAHHHLGSSLMNNGKPQQGIQHLRQALRLNSRDAGAWNNLGCALRKIEDVEGSLRAFQKAAQVRPAMAEAHCNVGTALCDLGRPDEAIPHLEKAVELRPDFADAQWNLAVALLACGHFDRGWLAYEWRRHSEKDKKFSRDFMQPAWNGCNIEGRTILVTCEQGLGDTLQFIRYIPMVAARGARVIFESQPSLRDLLRNMKGIDQIVVRGEPLPRFDVHVRLLTLPSIFGTRLGNFPSDVPYLHPDPKREAMWKQRLSGGGFKVGIAWQGSTTFANDRFRSIPLAEYEPLAQVEGVRLISLQKNAGSEQVKQIQDKFKVEILEPALDEGTGAFMDTAAVMRQLDLVITSDTAIAHLAGALGVRVWLALSYNSDWRWMRERDDSPWYPTMRLFRPQTPRDWNGVFDRIAVAPRDTLNAQPLPDPPPVLAPMAPGELIDRLSILQIKVQRVTDPIKLRTVRTELEQLLAVREKALPSSDQLDELARELRGVNETLWQIEDDIRAADQSGDFGPKFIELARSVYHTNDRRADLKRRINLLLGSVIRDEKHYHAHRR